MQAEPLHRLFHHLHQLRAVIGLLGCLRITRRDWHSSFTREDFNRLQKPDILGFLHKTDGIAFGVTAKAIVKSLAVIDVEAGRFFLMERARRPHVALALIGFAQIPSNLAPDDGRQGNAGAQLVYETGGQTHAVL